LEQKNRKFVVIELVIPEEEVYTRLSNRRICKSCGANFNVSLHGELDKCLKCGGEIYRRNDDVDQNAIKNRIDAYHTNIAPALEMLDKM
jgi:adenylate kinase